MQRNIWVIALLLYIYKPFSLISLDSVTKKILLRDIRWVTYGIAQAFRDLTSSIFAPLSKRSGREWPARFCSGVAERRMLWTKLETEATKIGRKIVPSSGLIVRMRWSATVHEHAQKKSVRCNQYWLALRFHPEVSISWCYPWETRTVNEIQLHMRSCHLSSTGHSYHFTMGPSWIHPAMELSTIPRFVCQWQTRGTTPWTHIFIFDLAGFSSAHWLRTRV